MDVDPLNRTDAGQARKGMQSLIGWLSNPDSDENAPMLKGLEALAQGHHAVHDCRTHVAVSRDDLKRWKVAMRKGADFTAKVSAFEWQDACARMTTAIIEIEGALK